MRPTYSSILRQFDACGDLVFQVYIREKHVNVWSPFQERNRAIGTSCGKNLVPVLLQIGFGKHPNLLFVLDNQDNGHA